MSWAEILNMIYDILCGTNPNDCPWPEYPIASMEAWCDEAVRDLVSRSNILEARRVITTFGGTGVYDLPGDCHRIFQVSYDGDKLEPTSVSGIRNTNRWWEQYTGTPRFYYLDELNGRIGLYEIPSTGTMSSITTGNHYGFVVATGGGFFVDLQEAMPIGEEDYGFFAEVITGNELQVFYTADPPAFSSIDTPSLPGWAHPLIVYYTLSQSFAAFGPLQDRSRADFYRALYVWGRGRLISRSNMRLAEKRWIRESWTDANGDVLVSNRLPRSITPPA